MRTLHRILPIDTDDQKRRAGNRRQNRYWQNRRRGVEVVPVPLTRVARRFLVEVLGWIDKGDLEKLDDQQRRRAFGAAIAQDIEDNAAALASRGASNFYTSPRPPDLRRMKTVPLEKAAT